jgi:hypothetical protein
MSKGTIMHQKFGHKRQMTPEECTRTTLLGMVRSGQHRADPMLTDINNQRLQEIISKHLRKSDLTMLEKKLRRKPSSALRGVCLNLLNRGHDARMVARNTVHLLDVLGKNILHVDGKPNYLYACHLISTVTVDITTLSDTERNSLVQTLLMSHGATHGSFAAHHRPKPADLVRESPGDSRRRS